MFAVLTDVEPGEVMQMLGGAGGRWPRRSIGPHGIPVLTILGRTKTGRPITVHARHEEGLDYGIIAARPMTAAELEEFEAWEAQR